MYQKVIVRGRSFIDPIFKFLEDGTPVVNFIIVVNRKSNRQKSDKIPAVAWGETAKLIDKHIKKGDMAFYEGEIRTTEKTNEEGKTDYYQNFEIEHFNKEFKSKQKDGDDSNE
jgi:single-stranded DNA-binding protein